MKEEDKKEFINLINEGFEQVILPHIEVIHGDMSELKNNVKEIRGILDDHSNKFNEIEETLEDHGNRLERVERKLDAVVSTQDRQGVEIKKIKTHISLT